MTTLKIKLLDPDGTVSNFKIEDPLVGFDRWTLLNPASSKILSGGGGVDEHSDGLTLTDSGSIVVKLIGLDWNSLAGAAGSAECELCDTGCSPSQTWELVEVD